MDRCMDGERVSRESMLSACLDDKDYDDDNDYDDDSVNFLSDQIIYESWCYFILVIIYHKIWYRVIRNSVLLERGAITKEKRM